MELTTAEREAFARIAANLGKRSSAFRVPDDTIRALAKDMQNARKRTTTPNTRVNDADDATYGALRDAAREMFKALDDARDAFKTRHANGVQAFRDAIARYHVLSRVPVPASALSTRYGSEVLNYARKHWHNYATTNSDDERLATAGFGIDSPNHARVTDEPEDAVQVAILHILESGERITVGNIYRAVKYAAARLSRGYRAWDYARETPLPAYDHTQDQTVQADYASVEEWRNAIRAYAAHRDYADKVASIRAHIADLRDTRAALAGDALRAVHAMLRAGHSAETIARLSGKSLDLLTRECAEAGRAAFPRVTFLPAMPEDRDDVSTDIEETMLRRARAYRALAGIEVHYN